MRLDVQPQDAVVVATSGGALAGQVLGAETLDQVDHGRGGPLGLDRAQGIAAILDLSPQLPGLVAGVRASPDRGVAYGVGPLPPRPGGVPQHVAAGPVGGDAGAEAGNVGVDGDGLALLGGWKSPHNGVGESCHRKSYARPMPVVITAYRVQRCNGRVATSQQETAM